MNRPDPIVHAVDAEIGRPQPDNRAVFFVRRRHRLHFYIPISIPEDP